jgi:peptidoglycan/xylan/chitin deacetylase (PgdA/CDA1 family)
MFPTPVHAYPPGTAFVSDYENVADWAFVSGEPIVADTIHYVQGTQGIKFTSINSSFTREDRVIVLDATNKQFEMDVWVDNVTNLSWLGIFFQSGGGWGDYFDYYTWVPFLNNGWNKLIISRPSCTVGGGVPDWATITAVRCIVVSNADTTVNVTLDNFVMIPTIYTGKVTFRFDDGLTDQYTLAKPILDTYGYKAVIAVIINSIGWGIHMNQTQLLNLQTDGWDIVSHTMNHYPMDSISAANATLELSLSKTWLINNGFPNGARFYIAPYGQYVVQDALAKSYYESQSLMITRYENLPITDPYRVAIRIEIVDATPLATLKTFVDDAKTYGCWVIFLVHDVTPAVATLLTDITAYINAQGVDVVTYSDVFIPDAPTNFVISPNIKGQVNLSWTKGNGADNTIIRYQQGGYPSTPTSGASAYNGSSSSATVSDLPNGNRYFFRGWSSNNMDGNSQYSNTTAEANSIVYSMNNTFMIVVLVIGVAFVLIILATRNATDILVISIMTSITIMIMMAIWMFS